MFISGVRGTDKADRATRGFLTGLRYHGCCCQGCRRSSIDDRWSQLSAVVALVATRARGVKRNRRGKEKKNHYGAVRYDAARTLLGGGLNGIASVFARSFGRRSPYRYRHRRRRRCCVVRRI